MQFVTFVGHSVNEDFVHKLKMLKMFYLQLLPSVGVAAVSESARNMRHVFYTGCPSWCNLGLGLNSPPQNNNAAAQMKTLNDQFN